MQIGEMAKLIRSKNAGPFSITIDLLFENEAYYRRVKTSPSFTVETIAELYHLDRSEMHMVTCDPILALKISFDRPIIAGDIGDGDVFGGQQHGPLVELEV